MMFGVNFHGAFFWFFGGERQMVVHADLHAIDFPDVSPTDIKLVETGAPFFVVKAVDRENLLLFGLGDGEQFGNLSKIGLVLLQQDDGIRIVYDAVLDNGVADYVIDFLCYLDDLSPDLPYGLVQRSE